MDVTRSAKTLV